MRRLTVDDLILEVRSLMDQDNEYSLTDHDILLALNASYDRALTTLSKHYPEPLLHPVIIPANSSAEYILPKNVLEDKIRKIEIKQSSTDTYEECSRVSVRDRHLVHGNRYFVYDNKIVLAKFANANARELVLWVLQDPLPLDKTRGEITKVGGTNYFYITNLDADISVDALSNQSLINIVDGDDGRIKGSYQVNSIVDGRIDIKANPLRSTFRGREILGELEEGINPGDFICLAGNSCIPFRKKPISNFLVQFAVARLNGKLGEDQGVALGLSKSFEDDIKTQWSGRESGLRIKRTKRSTNFYRNRWR